MRGGSSRRTAREVSPRWPTVRQQDSCHWDMEALGGDDSKFNDWRDHFQAEPARTVTLALYVSAKTDATLASLAVRNAADDTALDIGTFATGTLDDEATVPGSVARVTVLAAAAGTGASVSYPTASLVTWGGQCRRDPRRRLFTAAMSKVSGLKLEPTQWRSSACCSWPLSASASRSSS